MDDNRETWTLDIGGVANVVTVRQGTVNRRVTWTAGDTRLATKSTSDRLIVLFASGHGAVGVRSPRWTGPTRRVTWFDATDAIKAQALVRAGVGGREFEPVAGSSAARRYRWIEEHPRLHVLRQVGMAAVGVAAPMLLALVVLRLHLDLPNLPLPHVSIPWPHWNVPWPHWRLPDITLPGWLVWLLGLRRLIAPIVIALVVARADVRRRRAATAANASKAGDPQDPRAGDEADPPR